MKRTFPTLVLFFTLPAPLVAQTSSQPASPSPAPSFVQPALGQKLRVSGIPNAGKVSENLYRGAQPKEVGLSEMKLLGITMIVDLRGEDHEKLNWERKRAEALGMRFVQ